MIRKSVALIKNIKIYQDKILIKYLIEVILILKAIKQKNWEICQNIRILKMRKRKRVVLNQENWPKLIKNRQIKLPFRFLIVIN